MANETLVMLPGMMCDERLFAPQIAASQAEHDIIVPRLCSPASVTGMAERVLNEVKSPHFNLLGLSMGGIIAMAMAQLAPTRIKRLALLDTNHQADASERCAVRNRQIADVQNGHLRAVIVEEMKPNYLAARNRGNSDVLGTLISMAMELGPGCFIAQSIALRDRPDYSEALRRYTGPTLVLCGAEDSLCPPERHRQIAGLCANAELKIVEGAGHISTLEQPGAVNQALRHWLACHLEEMVHA